MGLFLTIKKLIPASFVCEPPGFISLKPCKSIWTFAPSSTTNWMPCKKAPPGTICKLNCKRFVCWFQKCSCMRNTNCNVHSWQMCQHRLCSQPRCRWDLRIQFRDFKCLLKPRMFNTESFEHSEQAQDWRKGVACILYHYQLHFIFNWFKHLKVVCKYLLCSNRWSIKVYCKNDRRGSGGTLRQKKTRLKLIWASININQYQSALIIINQYLSASMSTNQLQSASISIKHDQSASVSISISINQHL